MFSHLTELSYKRKKWEILGFYISYLVLLVMTSAVTGNIVGTLTKRLDDFQLGYQIGIVVSIIFCTVLAVLIANTKNKLNDTKTLVLLLATVALSYLGGGLLGLIPGAYLSSVQKHA